MYEEFEDELLPAAMATLSRWTGQNIVLDLRAIGKDPPRVTASLHNVQVDAAVRILAEQADLQVARVDNVLYVTTAAKAARLQKEWRKPNPPQPEPDAKKAAR